MTLPNVGSQVQSQPRFWKAVAPTLKHILSSMAILRLCLWRSANRADTIGHLGIFPNMTSSLRAMTKLLLTNRNTPICRVPPMRFGSMPRDGGNLILDQSEKEEFLAQEPGAARWMRPYTGAQEFLNGDTRWCLWLTEIPPAELRSLPHVMARVQRVKEFRLASKAESTRKFAATPTMFCQIAQPKTDYLLVPRVSSERRAFVPMGFMTSEVVGNDQVLLVPETGLFHFGILSSTMHNAWVRYTCGRLESRYRYSKDIVYNNFPWPDFPRISKPNQPPVPVDKAQAAIETAAQAVLDVRVKFQTGDQPATLADLYDPLSMPPELLKAHQKLDAAVDKAYEGCGGKKSYKSDAERVAFLFELYQKYTSLLPTTMAPSKKRRVK